MSDQLELSVRRLDDQLVQPCDGANRRPSRVYFSRRYTVSTAIMRALGGGRSSYSR